MAEGGQEKILAETQNYQVKAKKKKLDSIMKECGKSSIQGLGSFIFDF